MTSYFASFMSNMTSNASTSTTSIEEANPENIINSANTVNTVNTVNSENAIKQETNIEPEIATPIENTVIPCSYPINETVTPTIPSYNTNLFNDGEISILEHKTTTNDVNAVEKINSESSITSNTPTDTKIID